MSQQEVGNETGSGGTNPTRCTSLEVQKEPAVAEVEVGVVSVLVHELKQLRVKDLQ